MWVVMAGVRTLEREGVLERMAADLRGGGTPRLWRDAERNAGAAALAGGFVPEGAYDVQPLVTPERVFVCQARIDNRDEVLALLGIAEGSTMADSSIFAAAYDRWSTECVHRICGEFSFAAWHRDDGRVVCGVDHLGVRRLYWLRVANGFVLSAQMPPLLLHPEASRDPDVAAMATLFDAGIDRTTTPFRAIRAVPGGHVATFRGNDVTLRRWWNPEWQPSIWYRRPAEYVEDLREHFTRATTAMLRSSTPVSTTLSGGLDSGSVTSLAAQLVSPRRIAAYTSVPEAGLIPSERAGWEPDDRAYAAEVAAQHDNVDHHLVSPDGRCVADVIRDVHARSLTPTKAATNLLWLDRISDLAVAAGSRVLLTGQHGNAAFSWRGEGAVWELLRLGRIRELLPHMRAEARARQVSTAYVAAQTAGYVWRTWLRPRAQPRLEGLRYLSNPSAARARNNEYAFRAGTRQFWMRFATTPRAVWSPDPVRQWGIEWRDPTGERRLLERLLRFPQAAFSIGGWPRGLARALALLPERVRFRKTQGAQVPEAASLIAANAPKYAEALAAIAKSGACRALFDVDVLVSDFNAFRASSRDHRAAIVFDRAIDVGTFLAAVEGSS